MLKKDQKPSPPFLSKAGPFPLGNHICDKALKCKVFQIIRCLIKPLFKKKNSIQTIFQRCTSWVVQLLNNMNVWMVLYFAQQLLGLEKNKNLLHLSLSKAGPFTLGNHICVKVLKCKVSQIIRCLIKPLLKKKTASRQFFKGVPHEWLSYSIIWIFGWYSIVPNNFWGWKNKNLLHLSLSKAGPFTLGNHICVKALKCKVFQIIRCLMKQSLKKTASRQFSRVYLMSGWVTQ